MNFSYFEQTEREIGSHFPDSQKLNWVLQTIQIRQWSRLRQLGQKKHRQRKSFLLFKERPQVDKSMWWTSFMGKGEIILVCLLLLQKQKSSLVEWLKFQSCMVKSHMQFKVDEGLWQQTVLQHTREKYIFNQGTPTKFLCRSTF